MADKLKTALMAGEDHAISENPRSCGVVTEEQRLPLPSSNRAIERITSAITSPRSKRADLTFKLFYGTVSMLFIFGLLFAVSMGVGAGNTITDLCSLALIVVFLCGAFVPRTPWSANHMFSTKTRIILGQIFFYGLFAVFLWFFVGAILSWIYVRSYVESYCNDCGQDCGCENVCKDNQSSLRTLVCAAVAVGVLVGALLTVTFMGWTQRLVALLERDLDANRPVSLRRCCLCPDIDGWICCCCPGVRHRYRPSEWSRATGESMHAVDAAVSGATNASMHAVDVAVSGATHAVGDTLSAVGAGLQEAGDGVYTCVEKIFPVCCCLIFVVSFTVAGFLCWDTHVSQALQTVCCIYFFVIYVIVEVAAEFAAQKAEEYD